MMTAARRVAATVAMLSLAACGGSDPVPAEDQAIAVTTAVVESRDLRQTLALSGTAVPASGAEQTVYAPELATIAEMPRAEGDTVAMGDLLVRFDHPQGFGVVLLHLVGDLDPGLG